MGRLLGHVRAVLPATIAAIALATATTAVAAPAVTGTPNGAAGVGGWYRGVTQIAWSVTPDPGFALVPPQPGPTAVGEGAGVTYTSGPACEWDGLLLTLCATGSLTLSVDSTPPLLGPGAPDRPPNGNGWYRAPVTVSFPCVDGLSGILGGCPAVTRAANGAGLGVGPVSALDLAGNASAPRSFVGLNIDQLAPTTSIGRPAAATYERGQGVTAAYDCADQPGLSGMVPGRGPGAGCAGPVGNGAAVDTSDGGRDRTFTVRATDRAGNQGIRTVTYRVAPTPVQLLAPAAGVTTNNRRPAFAWNTSVDSAIDHYELWIRGRKVLGNVGPGSCGGRACQITVTPPDLGPPFAPLRTPIEWYVRAVGRNGVARDSAHRVLTIDPTVPNAPTLTGGPVGSTEERTPTVTWVGLPGATFFWRVVGVGETVVQQGPLGGQPGGAATLGPLPDGSYAFEVRQALANGVQGDAAVLAFTVGLGAAGPQAAAGAPPEPPAAGAPLILPPAPATVATRKAVKRRPIPPRTLNARLLRPKAGAKLRTLTPVLRWKGRPKGAKAFNVQILSASKKVLSRFPAGQALRVPRGILKPGQRYLWRVWPYFGPKRGYPARPLAVSYLDTLAARPASGAAARGGRPT